MISPARTAAFDILLEVERGGYASELLDAVAAPLDARDAALAHRIVFGALRYRAQLDYLIAHWSGRSGKLDVEVRTALRAGVYQLRYLERVPAHAAVTESVDLVKRARKRSAAGFVNAVLRKATRDAVEWPDRATALSCPAWLLERWDRSYGRDAADAIARAALEEPERYVRAPHGGPGLEATDVAGCYRVVEGAGEGFRRQDIGSQTIAPLLGLAPGQRFLDLCAAPGGKTAQALESGVRAVACDLHPHRIRQLAGMGAALVTLDGTRPLPFGRIFDRILVDAPCSGTGTLARNPEIKWRLRPEDLTDLQRRQRALLAHALDTLAPGGTLVYSTCSLEAEENEQVIGNRAASTWRRLPGRDPGDGFFAARLEMPDLPDLTSGLLGN
jgi:16S rRNA (cytosine967-C5)-methyltransferase